MSAGYIQLAAIGQQDAYLTGEPQVTYFSGIYKRHTPFVLETYDIPFKEQLVNYGGTSVCQIPPKGDLIRGLTLKVVLPALTNPGNDWTWGSVPNITNYPNIWFGLTNGTVVYANASYQYQYYSSNSVSLAQWFTPNFKYYASYSTTTNKFTFSNVSIGISNVIVSTGLSSSSASSGVFWGLDPLAATTTTSSNLIYNAVSGVVSPSLTLEQAGWIQTAGLPTNPLPSLYLTLNQTLPLSGQQFINFSATSASGAYWTQNDVLASLYKVTTNGTIQFLQPGYFTIRAGFSVGSGGSIQSLSYGTSTKDGPYVNYPPFTYVYDSVVSPDPSSPSFIPIIITDPTLFYYFYATTTGAQLLTGTYFSVSPTNDIYQFSNDVVLSRNSLAPVPLYGNVTPSNTTVTLNPDSTMSFVVNGEYLISGALSLADTSYISNVVLGEGANTIYTYDMSLQGRNPTYAFSIPLVASTLKKYYLNVSTQGTLSPLRANSFFAINQVGVLADTQPGTILPYNGILFQTTSNTLTAPFQLKSSYFSSNTNSGIISTTSEGNLSFKNVMSYIMTGVFYTSNTVTSLTIGSSDPAFTTPVYNVALGIAPPYTFSVPFRVTNTAATYSISVSVDGTTANVLSGTYISVAPLASNAVSSTIGATYAYYDSVATYLVKNADLKIGGQTIQSITGEYIEIWNELNIPYENQPGLQLLTGKYDTGTTITPPGRVYYANLPFYFFGSPELSLPITALGRQDVEVWVTFRNFSELTAVSVTNPTLTATIITDYVYLSNPEINWFQNHRLDYVITQTQYQTFDLAQGFQTAIFPIDFKGPVKELFFVIQVNGNLPYNYSGNDLESIGMTYNGEDAILTSVTNDLYLGAIQPFEHHVNFFSMPPGSTIPGREFYMYSFSTNPYGSNPSGQINMSRIRNILLELNIFNSTAYYPAKQFRIIAMSQNVLRVENGIAGLMFE
jgi:hypothetical protein